MCIKGVGFGQKINSTPAILDNFRNVGYKKNTQETYR